jgi:hypothetical protein
MKMKKVCYTPSGFHSKMQQALQYMRSCQINVKILTGNSSSLLFKLSCQQPTFQCPDIEDAVLRAVTAVLYVPNGWWKQVGYVLRPDGLLDFVLDYAV